MNWIDKSGRIWGLAWALRGTLLAPAALLGCGGDRPVFLQEGQVSVAAEVGDGGSEGNGGAPSGGVSGNGDGDRLGDADHSSGDTPDDENGEVDCPESGPNRVCTKECPCGAGEGVCLNSDQCDDDLVCTPDAEAKLNFPGSSCLPEHCINDVQDAEETSVDCGGGCGCRATYEVVQITGVPSDANFSHLSAMAGDGRAFAGVLERGLRWPYPARIDANGVVKELDGFGAPGNATAISDDGSVLAGDLYCEDPPDCTVQGERPFRWADGDPVAVDSSGSVRAISATGSIMVGDGLDDSSAGHAQAFRVSGSRNIVINEMRYVRAISADGEFIVGSSSSTNAEVLWSATRGVVPLTPPRAWTSFGIDVLNADGSVFAGHANINDESRSFLWRNGTFSDFPQLPGADYDNIRGMSSDGSVVAGSSGTSSLQRAFLWDEVNGMRTVLAEVAARGLELPVDLELSSADFISNDGRTLVGWNDNNTFWRVTLLP